MSNILADLHIENKLLNKRIVTVSKKLITASNDVQQVLCNIAAQIEMHNDCDGLTKLVVALSTTDRNDKVVLSSHAQQIGLYMQDVCPVHWDKEDQKFRIQKKAAKDWDWSKSLAKLDTSWTEFGMKKADSAFDAYSKLRGALAAVQAVCNTSDVVDERLLTEANTLLSKMGGLEKLLGQIKDERQAAKKEAA